MQTTAPNNVQKIAPFSLQSNSKTRDALPVNGKLHVRDPKPKEGAEESLEAAQSPVATEMATA